MQEQQAVLAGIAQKVIDTKAEREQMWKQAAGDECAQIKKEKTICEEEQDQLQARTELKLRPWYLMTKSTVELGSAYVCLC